MAATLGTRHLARRLPPSLAHAQAFQRHLGLEEARLATRARPFHRHGRLRHHITLRPNNRLLDSKVPT